MANGGRRPGAGRKPGSRNKKTLEEAAVLSAFRQRAMERAITLFDAQFLQAMGTTHLFRVEKRKGEPDRHVLVESTSEIRRFLDEHGQEGSGLIDEQYYYISTKDPDFRAADSILDRTFGKAAQSLVGKDVGPIQLEGITITFKQ